ncbi:hypothetical protein NC651_029905 [Populus alba x Populus x berolinensis]|nr:hypothetical protein NC651_029905 [Populus alba x Populus x berolinensis]
MGKKRDRHRLTTVDEKEVVTVRTGGAFVAGTIAERARTPGAAGPSHTAGQP